MKKYLGLFVVLILTFVSGINITKAQDNLIAPNTERNQIRAEIQKLREQTRADIVEKRAEIKQQVQNMREEMKQKMTEFKAMVGQEKDAVKAKIQGLRITARENAMQRFSNVLDRMHELKDRIDTKIDELAKNGVDVSVAEGFSETAGTKLSEAENKVTEINNLLTTSIEELTEENKTTIRTMTQATQTLIKEAHQALKDAVQSLKDSLKSKAEENSQTEATENNE